jgi:UDP-N-acetylmuramoylalanine--D-glutamate ligase
MNIHDLNHRNVCILGFGMEGRATLTALQRYAPDARITIADSNPNLTVEGGYGLITGPNYLNQLGQFDVIIKSPGIAWRPEPALQAKLTSATELFMDSLPQGVTVIGVTGTKGKSTTSNLIYRVLKAAGRRVFLAGNIGEPMLGFLEQATPKTTFVLELSSYQLETLRVSPHIAVVTSFFPDHLDYHGGLSPYHQAKMNIARYQTAADIVFYNPSYPECRAIAELSPGRKETFVPADYPGQSNPAYLGEHNTSNFAAAYKVARYCGVSADVAVAALQSATGLPHRQEPLGRHHGLDWIDDSAANTPEAAVAAIKTLGDTVDTLIVGGLDRGYDFTELGQILAKSPIKHVVLFPNTGAKIRAIAEATPGYQPKTYFETSDITEAVKYAAKHAATGKAVLLSNGSPSYNLFKNFTERARAFKAAIANLEQA